MDNKFFNTQFWRMAAIAGIFGLVFGGVLTMFVGAKLDELVALSESLGTTLTQVQSTIDTVVGIDPTVLDEKAEAIAEGATTVGTGLGDGGAETVDRIGDAWNKFRNGGTEEKE